ncbi:preprotein translocase subunit YajC [Agromyces aurantiacus]|uniref:Preprotein translocase subunit YajC n=1 Tax=Agromyces aurantiacus TaxID=165814 RepID=A0ABV9RA39_9MICO|nr:preprotein translocase subunit YajC [Agromyces aurantiacus]MBM7504925.1 preprotein translocase subunit YajC [Agromyces aurantiacus]
MVFDPFTIIMLAVLAVLIFFMFRNSRKRQADMRDLQSKIVPGAKVMTNFGLFGTILAIDEEENRVELKAGPGTVLTVHRQTIARVVDAADETAASTAVVEGEPEFGERVDEAPGDETPDVKKSDD